MVRTFLSLVAVAFLVAAPIQLDAAQHSGAQHSAAQQPARARGAKPSATAVVNINSATSADLEVLPGIGAKTAARIIEYRQKNGPFKKVEELMNVRGVGEKSFLKLKAQLTVAPLKAEQGQPQQ